MSTDYREKEREFLDSLKDDTGRDVREWMAAITEQNLPHRNDIIDWLRQQGFMFSKASWLERVHHNGGKPIYSNAAAAVRRASPKRPAAAAEAPAAPPAPEPPAVPQVAAPAVQAAPDAMETLLATAKAYRPLAQHLLREVAKAVPGTMALPAGSHVSLVRDGNEFAILAMAAKELRLGLALTGHAIEPPLQAAKIPNPLVHVPPGITHMAVLNDVRQIDSGLMAWIVKAAGKTAAAA
jgi:hypothetical protein